MTTGWLRLAAARTLAELEQHQAVWQSWHVHAEVQRQIRGADIPPEHLPEISRMVTDEVVGLSVSLSPDLDPTDEPGALRRADRASVFRHTGRDRYSSLRVLEAEQRIVSAAACVDGPGWTTDDVDLGVLAAGAGKTTAMRVLAGVWTEAGATAIGLAPSAAAAAALRDATGMPCETLAKLVHDLDARPDSQLTSQVESGALLVIDEAGMADTISLDRVIAFAVERGAVVRLVGDDQQLAAVGAGGVLRDIARTHGAVRLDEVIRFDDPIEAEASLALRDGDRSALGYYFDHERIHPGEQEGCLDDVFDAWQREHASGRDCLMLAPTRELVRELNERARSARLAGATPADEVRLADGTSASAGDVVLTRRNDRRLGISGSDWVKNGDRWTVTGVHAGRLSVRHCDSGLTTVLPTEYVAAHLELGYASTVHTAQGLTVDVMHGVVTGQETRQLMYTMLTRGRSANHVHVVTANGAEQQDRGNEHQLALPGLDEQLTASELLERVLARDGAAVSATSTRHESTTPEARLHDAAGRYADALAYATHKLLDAADDEPVGVGPLPWLPSIPVEATEHPSWGAHLAARARLLGTLAGQVHQRAEATLPTWLDDYDDVLTPHLRAEGMSGFGRDTPYPPRISCPRLVASVQVGARIA